MERRSASPEDNDAPHIAAVPLRFDEFEALFETSATGASTSVERMSAAPGRVYRRLDVQAMLGAD